MMIFAMLIGSCLLSFALWQITSIARHYVAARKIGLPIIISPVSPLNPFWALSYRIFPSILSLRRLPYGLGTWARCTAMGWAFEDKHQIHDECGPLFTLVTPAGNEVTIADPIVAHTIFARRKDYVKPTILYGTYL